MVWNAHLQAKTVCGKICGDDVRRPKISRNECVGPRIFEKQRRRREIINSPQRRFGDSRVVVSHYHFRQSQSAQCLRNNIGLVRRTCSTDFRSFVFQYGKTRCGDGWRIGVSNLTQCCVNFTESTFDQCSSTGRLVAGVITKDSNVFQQTVE